MMPSKIMLMLKELRDGSFVYDKGEERIILTKDNTFEVQENHLGFGLDDFLLNV